MILKFTSVIDPEVGALASTCSIEKGWILYQYKTQRSYKYQTKVNPTSGLDRVYVLAQSI